MEKYDSEDETRKHIGRVQILMLVAVAKFCEQVSGHDASKLEEPEKSAFDEMTPKLKGSTYGSDEYKAFLVALKPALDHHYAVNRHHPEHFAAGVSGMGLLDVLEMLCDWKAATERHADGDLARSIEINKARFGISDQLAAILINTAERLGWLNPGVQATAHKSKG